LGIESANIVQNAPECPEDRGFVPRQYAYWRTRTEKNLRGPLLEKFPIASKIISAYPNRTFGIQGQKSTFRHF
jgi:hypothetical protein